MKELVGERAKEKISDILEAKPLLANFKEILLNKLSDRLPPWASLPNLSYYWISPKKGDILKVNVEELLRKGQIQKSLSSCAVPTLLTPNKGGSWWVYKDSCAINKITMGYKFSISQLDDIFDQLHGASSLTKINFRSGYH